MQNQQGKPNRFVQFLRRNGYYMVLAVCLVAVGVSGWVFLRTALRRPAQEALDTQLSVSLPARADVPEVQTPQTDPEKTDLPTQSSQPEDTVPVVGTQPQKRTVVRPVSGETVQTHSVDRLCYNATMRDWRTHDGVDLACAVGAQVRAAMAGEVSRVYDDDFLGTVVELSHADGYTTIYANLTRMPTVSQGDTVQLGQVIGAVGESALGESAQTAHLHFAVKQNGASLDPMDFLNP